MLSFHHTGCLVKDIEIAIDSYTKLLGHPTHSGTFHIASQGVKVCFFELGDGTFLELVEPDKDNVPLQNKLKSGTTFYHMAYVASNLDESVAEMEQQGARVVTAFHSEALDHRKCVFLYTPEMHLIELIEPPRQK